MKNERRVVITGWGIWSSIGNTFKECLKSLYTGISGIKFCSEYEKVGLPSQVRGELRKPKRAKKVLGKHWKKASLGTLYATEAFLDAVTMAKISLDSPLLHDSGVNIGTGGGAPLDVAEIDRILRQRGARRIGPTSNFKVLPNNPNIVLGTVFGLKGGNYGISSACATANNCILDGFIRIKAGFNDTMLVGGCDENDELIASTFCALKALSTGYNNNPVRASRPYDAKRDGFVMAGGAGVLVLEELELALERGAPILAEILGGAFTSDGYKFTAPSMDGAKLCMRQALRSAGISADEIDYINTHATSTPVGDVAELRAIRRVFGPVDEREYPLIISSTKGLTGHGLGAAGAQEIIYSLIMMDNGFIPFIAPMFIEELDPQIKELGLASAIPLERKIYPFDTFLSNSFGFGGSNASVVVRKFFS